LPGHATEEGTDRFYRKSQYDDLTLNVHYENFKTLFGTNTRISTLAYGSYTGEPDDWTDFQMYDAIKQSVLSGGINHIDTAPNFRYTKSERTIGKILTSLHHKYGVKRDQLFVASKVGYVPEDCKTMVSQREAIEKFIKEDGIPESEFTRESGHCLHPKFLQKQLDDTLDRLNL